MYSINTATGALTSIGNTGISGAMGLTYESEPVPEPATLALLGSALLGVFGIRRRFNRG